MEFIVGPVVIGVFIALSIIFLVLIFLEYRQIKEYRAEFPLVEEAIREIVEVVNKNSDLQTLQEKLIRENIIDIALLKALVDVQGSALNIRISKDISAKLDELKENG